MKSIALHQAGVDHLLLDRLSEGQNTSRAAVIHAQTLDSLALRHSHVSLRQVQYWAEPCVDRLEFVAAMLRRGGYFLHNELRPELDDLAAAAGLEAVQARTMRVGEGRSADAYLDSSQRESSGAR